MQVKVQHFTPLGGGKSLQIQWNKNSCPWAEFCLEFPRSGGGGLLSFYKEGWKAWTLLLQRQKKWFFHRSGSNFWFIFTLNSSGFCRSNSSLPLTQRLSSELMAVLAEACSLALNKYSSSSKCICSSVVCWNGMTPTQKTACRFRETLTLNETGFKWEKGGVAGISSIVRPLWGWHLRV